MDTTARQATERKVVRHLIRTAKAHGYAVTKVWDGEGFERTTTERAAMDVVFSVDECRLYFKHPDEPKSHIAVIILGNDGWDAIADSSMGGNWDAVMQESGDYCDKLSETI